MSLNLFILSFQSSCDSYDSGRGKKLKLFITWLVFFSHDDNLRLDKQVVKAVKIDQPAGMQVAMLNY